MKATLALTAVLLCCCIGCRNSKPELEVASTGIDVTNAYSLFAGVTKPAMVPAEVTHLQAGGAVWMDMHILCRFHAPGRVIDAIIARATNGQIGTLWSLPCTPSIIRIHLSRLGVQTASARESVIYSELCVTTARICSTWQLIGRRVLCTQSQKAKHMTEGSNKPDAVNPAITLRFAFEDQWRRVTDLER